MFLTANPTVPSLSLKQKINFALAISESISEIFRVAYAFPLNAKATLDAYFILRFAIFSICTEQELHVVSLNTNKQSEKLNIRTGYEYGSGYDKTTISVTGKVAAINVYGTNANILKDVVLPTELRPAVPTFIVGAMLYNSKKYLAFLGISADGTIGISYLPTYPDDNIWPGGVPCYFTGSYALP